ncbi:hypothetical protein [Aureimonas psammosilenae]|uniref:hypothetical protein n=1 Tax=Aureimonas psammosilenae TaxID=2495496 RepID=UPI0012611896|nr:hypothetical protein [Aureimonas psammosilenae]
MLNRTAIMRSAWAEYRRAGLVQFCRKTFARILRDRWFAARLVANRAGIMVAAWARYRTVATECGYARFDRRLFARVLRMAWINARAAQVDANSKRRAARPRKPVELRPLTPMQIALDAVKYLPAHMSAGRAEAQIRAAYAA